MKIVKMSQKVLNYGMRKGTCLNVNIPNVNQSDIKGIKVCRQGRAFWDDTFDKRTDPLQRLLLVNWFLSSKEKESDADINIWRIILSLLFQHNST